MKKYKLKKDFLYLQAGKIVDIEKKKDKNNVTRYIISIEDWVIAEIIEATHFVFDEYFEEIKPKNIFDLQRWDGYYYLFSDWDIDSRDYYWDETYKDLIENWNAFLTKEEAEKEVERRKAIQRECFRWDFLYWNNLWLWRWRILSKYLYWSYWLLIFIFW